MITRAMNDGTRRACREVVRSCVRVLAGHAAPDGPSPPGGGPASSSGPGGGHAAGKSAPCAPVGVERRGTSVRLACGCGHFVLSFHSLGVVRHGRFRCPLCGREVRLAQLETLREIWRTWPRADAG